MVSGDQYELVCELVDDAVKSGATLRCGGPVEVEGFPDGNFIAPVVPDRVTHEMRDHEGGDLRPGAADHHRRVRSGSARTGQRFEFGWAPRSGPRTASAASGSPTDRGRHGLINDHMFTHGARAPGAESRFRPRPFAFKFGLLRNAWEICFGHHEPGLTRNFWWHPL